MNDQRIGAGGNHRPRQRIERGFRVLVVDTDPAFDRDGDGDGSLHRGYACRDQFRLRHQAGAETPVLHPIRRAADVEIDFVIAEILADRGGGCEVSRVGAAELERHGMFACVETQEPLAITMKNGASGQHLRVQPATPRHQTMEDAAMPVGPVHHRGDGKSPLTDTATFFQLDEHFSHFHVCLFGAVFVASARRAISYQSLE